MTTDIDNSCTFSTSGLYGSACAVKSSGSYYTTQYRTWYKVQVPATGIVGMDVQPLVGSERHYVKTMLFTNLTCSGSTASASFSSPDNCSWVNESNCGGGDVCGPNGTLTLYTDLIGTADGLGSQSYWSGLTPGSYVWLCVDLLGVVSGASSPYTAQIETCFWDSFAGDVNNFIGGAGTPCGGTVTGTTRSSLQGLSLCSGFKPPNCGGGPAPSYENVSIYKMTADAAGTDITIDLTGASCEGSTAGLQFLIYSAGDISGCTGTTPLCGSGTCTLGSCLGGNTASGLGDKTYTIVAPTPNQTFFVMIDGFAGSICSFNITSTGCVPVPITLMDFVAVQQGDEAFIHWQTASEINNDYFVLERSLDGIEFRTIQKFDGQGTTSKGTSYEFVDQPNHNGTVYYRLKQVDFDGNESHSMVQAVNFGGGKEVPMEVTPNPVKERCEVKLSDLKIGEDITIEVFDLNGRVMLTETIEDNQLSHQVLELNLAEFRSGMYYVAAKKLSGTVQTKIIKE
ncbi:MAG: T9SS type A sorting domain-containing protein [Bacteroidetes bacterium]|nr:MAG: T9SS type A sorting domain-containing protein [Bacteroidota bacterium]